MGDEERKKREEGEEMIGIVLCHNQLEFTMGFVESVLMSKEKKDGLRIVMVNNGSTDGQTGEYLKGVALNHPSLFVYRENVENVLFTRACVDVINEYAGEDIYLLNNDMLVRDGWLDGRSQLGEWAVLGGTQLWNGDENFLTFVGGGDNYASHKSMWRWEAVEMYGKAVHEEKWVTFGAVMLNRQVYDAIGGMDVYYRFYCSDSEYCLRAIQGGYKVGVSPVMEIVHFGSQTTRAMMQDAKFKDNFVGQEDQIRFAEEYGIQVGNIDLRTPSSSNIKEWFDDYFNNMNIYERNKTLSKEKAQVLFDKFNLKDKIVIELGCAYGNTVVALRDLGAKAYGYDVSEVAIGKNTKEYLGACNIEQFNFLTVFKPLSVDFVVSTAFLEHIDNYYQVLDQMYQVLKKGGEMYHEIDTVTGTDKTHINIQSVEKWLEIFKKIGFTVVDYKVNGSKMLKIRVKK